LHCWEQRQSRPQAAITVVTMADITAIMVTTAITGTGAITVTTDTGVITAIGAITRIGNTAVTTRIRTTTETGSITQKAVPVLESAGKFSTAAKPFERDGRRIFGRLVIIPQ
jgi:hypothetical protein